MMGEINKMIKQAFSNVKTSFMGTITSTIPKDGKVAAKAGADNEARDIFIITPYGYLSMPDKQLDAQVIFNNSSRRTSMVGVDNFPIKPVDLKVNEVVIFNKQAKSYIYLKNDGTIDFNTPGNLNINAGGNVSIKGSSVTANGRNIGG